MQAPARLRAAVWRALSDGRAPAGRSDQAQQAELAASDGAAGDQFGFSLSIAGNTAVVGAPNHDSDTGAVYVFVRTGSAWAQEAELTASDASQNNFFGASVAISGSTLVVGAPWHNSYAGAAYVFTGSGSAWSQVAELTASDASQDSQFGSAVAVWGSTVVVGAPWANGLTGSAYVFTGSSGTWSQKAELTAADGAAYDEFGFSVAISGSRAVVGAPYRNDDQGSVYVFAGAGATWSLASELTASDAQQDDYFGYAVAVSGSVLLVGAPYHDSESGAAYVFAYSGGAWTQTAELTASDSVSAGDFGYAVAISGSTALVSALTLGSSTGTVYVFADSGGSWDQEAELTAAGGAQGDQLGFAVALSGSTVLAGTPYRNSGTGAAYVFTVPVQAQLTPSGEAGQLGESVAVAGDTAVVGAPSSPSGGSVLVFKRSGRDWSEAAQLADPDSGQGDEFGGSVALQGSTLVVGSPGGSQGTGAAWVFTGSGSSWSAPVQLTASDGAAGDELGSSVGVSGSTVLVGAPGHASAAGAAYVFKTAEGSVSQTGELADPDDTSGDRFGASVAISGSRTVVGAPGDDASTGAAYLFTGSGRPKRLVASDGAAGDEFGSSVAVSGSTVAVGAPEHSSGAGAVYVFSGSTPQAELTDPEQASGDDFGASVALSGGGLAIGAPGISGVGAVYLFIGPGGSWGEQAQLTAAGGGQGSELGSAVALAGSTAVAGAPAADSDQGAAYAFTGL